MNEGTSIKDTLYVLHVILYREYYKTPGGLELYFFLPVQIKTGAKLAKISSVVLVMIFAVRGIPSIKTLNLTSFLGSYLLF